MRVTSLTPLVLTGVLLLAPAMASSPQVGVYTNQASPQPEQKSDAETAKKVREALKQNQLPSQATSRIDVLVKDGKVFLSGSVSSKAESDKAEQVATGIAGSGMVTNSLQVKP
jgi:osmotically-inducible protein OsmY